MRRRTESEKEILGRVEVVLRDLRIKKDTRGYVPLVDVICYAYAFPQEELIEVLKMLEKVNYYVGVISEMKEESEFEARNLLLSSIVRTIETAIERADDERLADADLCKLKVLLKENDREMLEPQLLQEIGEEYSQYTHKERIFVFFSRKILASL